MTAWAGAGLSLALSWAAPSPPTAPAELRFQAYPEHPKAGRAGNLPGQHSQLSPED